MLVLAQDARNSPGNKTSRHHATHMIAERIQTTSTSTSTRDPAPLLEPLASDMPGKLVRTRIQITSISTSTNRGIKKATCFFIARFGLDAPDATKTCLLCTRFSTPCTPAAMPEQQARARHTKERSLCSQLANVAAMSFIKLRLCFHDLLQLLLDFFRLRGLRVPVVRVVLGRVEDELRV